MAAPHGVKLKDLKCDFTDNTAAQAHQDAQFEFGKHDVPVFDLDVGKISDALSLHGSLDPSILSIFQEKMATESVESEASLLSALSEILDSVDVETLSPFDVLPDAEIFSAPNHTLRNLLHSDRASALQCPKISQSPASKSGKELVMSDRQLRPRRHLETQSKISQRADDEKNPRENKRSARSFRIESDTIFPQDEREFLADLVRHMHPYCIRTHLEKEKEVHVSVEEEEEEEFVDVEGYEEPEENQSGHGLDPKAGSGSSLISKSEEDRDEDVCRNSGNTSSVDRSALMTTPQRSALLKTREKTRKTVTFAVNLTFVHEIPPDDESDSDSESTSSKSDITSPQKPKALSLQQYRLLRQSKQPREETRMDYRTKWPSLPDFPRELPAILPDLFKIGPHCGAMDRAPTVEVKISASQPREPTRSSHVKLRTPADLCTDPPNPVLVPLKPTLSSGINSPPAPTHSQADVCVSCEEVRLAEVMPVIIKATDSPTRAGSEPTAPSDSALMPTSVAEKLPEGQQNRTCGEIGIEATDLTSLLEQFETQASEGQNLPEVSRDEHQDRRPADLSSTAGLTPPATPPHQTWKPLVPVKSLKSSKTIQIIEPRPLPPSKTHSKLPSFTPALNPAQLFLDHDYCGIQGSKTSFDAVSSPCDYGVLLSPDSSPCRINTFEEAESPRGRGLRFSAPSPSPLDRGRRKRRGYDGGYRRSSSRSSCSSCASSSSSSSSSRSRSRSPPRKRYRSRHSGSSSSSRSSSRSSSPSSSPPPRERRSRSRSRSICGSRSGSHSPEPDWSESRCTWKSRRQKELNRLREEARKLRQQKAIEERRVVYVGGIRGNMSPSDLKDRFSLFGKVEDCTIHIRSHGDNYGFVTYYSRDDAYAAIENGSKLRRSDELPFDICFGGRRQFCKSNYADLDSNRDADGSSRSRCESFDFDTLLKQAQRQKR